VNVRGVEVDDESRCAHYRTSCDIVAIRFPCCGEYFACIECHRELAEHEAAIWPHDQFGEKAVLCGGCGHEMTIQAYLDCDSLCPACSREFNPNCVFHHHLYFETARFS